MASLLKSFDRGDLRALRGALATAEDLTGRFYCIPGREWPRFPYDVTTREAGPPLEDWAFADVVRLTASGTRFPERYRIRLRDDAILSAVHDAERGVELYPLLLYVLAHELVHVVRFGSGAAPFEAPPAERAAEERRVHRITRRVVRPVEDRGLRRVVGLFERAAVPEDGPPTCGARRSR